MKVFISWSGERSRQVAEALRVWLPRVMQAVDPWMSEADIETGSRWLSEVSKVLDETSIGIICVTHENLSSPWLHFEAGALSKALDQSSVCPIGLNLKPGQISGPLSQFQAVTLDEPGMMRVLSTLNKLIPERTLPDAELDAIFEVWWPSLDKALREIPEAPTPQPARATEDQLEELLQLAREQLRRENLRLEASALKDEKIDDIITLMERSTSALNPVKQSINSLQSNFMSALKEFQLGIGNDTPDTRAAIALAKILESQTPNLSNVDVDTSALDEMTEFLKKSQQESRSLTNSLLSKPEEAPPPTSA